MDWLSEHITNLNNPLLTQIAVLLDNEIIFAGIIILFAILACYLDKDQSDRKSVTSSQIANSRQFVNRRKIKKIAIALILALIIGYGLKYLLDIPRPCEIIPAKIECPSDSSFPSLHAIIAFTLMISLLDRKRYFLYLLFALFVAFTRIYLGVHTFTDVAASLVLSAIIYGIVDYYFKSKSPKKVRK